MASRSNKSNQGKSVLQRLVRLLKLLYWPIFELMEFKGALFSIIRRLVNRFIALAVLNYKCIKIRKEMDKVATYPQYEQLGLILDKLQGKDVWQADK